MSNNKLTTSLKKNLWWKRDQNCVILLLRPVPVGNILLLSLFKMKLKCGSMLSRLHNIPQTNEVFLKYYRKFLSVRTRQTDWHHNRMLQIYPYLSYVMELGYGGKKMIARNKQNTTINIVLLIQILQ